MFITRRYGFVVAAMVFSACMGAPSATYPPLPTFPVPAEILGAAMSGPSSPTVTCGAHGFPLEALDAPAGAEQQTGPEFDALRETLHKFGAEFPGAGAWTWRLVYRDEAHAEFVARVEDSDFGWVHVPVSRDGAGWSGSSIGECDPKVVIAPGFGPASWALDPAFPAPDATTKQLHLLVWERACSGGAPATGRISAPAVVYGDATVTVTLGVRPIEVPPAYAVTCPGPPGTPAILDLVEALGKRQLRDGGQVPAAPPDAPLVP